MPSARSRCAAHACAPSAGTARRSDGGGKGRARAYSGSNAVVSTQVGLRALDRWATADARACSAHVRACARACAREGCEKRTCSASASGRAHSARIPPRCAAVVRERHRDDGQLAVLRRRNHPDVRRRAACGFLGSARSPLSCCRQDAARTAIVAVTRAQRIECGTDRRRGAGSVASPAQAEWRGRVGTRLRTPRGCR